METLFQREHFTDLEAEALPIFQKTYDEVGPFKEHIPFDIDIAKYRALDEEGLLLCFTARKGSQLVGYAFFYYLYPPQTQTTLCGINDVIYVVPEHRGHVGPRLIDFMDSELKALGVKAISYMVGHEFDWGAVLRRKHYKPIGTVWMSWVGE